MYRIDYYDDGTWDIAPTYADAIARVRRELGGEPVLGGDEDWTYVYATIALRDTDDSGANAFAVVWLV